MVEEGGGRVEGSGAITATVVSGQRGESGWWRKSYLDFYLEIITKAPVKGILHGAIVANPLALTPNLEGKGEALKYLSHDLLSKFRSQPTRRLKDGEDHLAQMIASIGIAVMYRLSRNSNTWMPGLTPSTLVSMLQQCARAISVTLRGPERSWFRKISLRTIDLFGDLSRLFVANFLSCRVRQKNASHLFVVHQKDGESLKNYVRRFNQAILEVEDPRDKVIFMEMMEGLHPSPLFDYLSKNIPKTLSAIQAKADKHIAAEELAEVKRRKGGKEDHKRKEIDLQRMDYRGNMKPRKPKWDTRRRYLRKFVADRPRPTMPERGNIDNRPNVGDIQAIHRVFGLRGCSTSSRKRHAREAKRQIEEEVYIISPRPQSRLPHIGQNQSHHLHLSPSDEIPDHYWDRQGERSLEGLEAMFHDGDAIRKYDVFTWSQGEVLGIDPHIALHKLFSNTDHPLGRQKRRKFAPERLKEIEEEVLKFINANVVMT
ncbi:Actin cytoskeleton-regulatory complex protein [Actinidia chinensis var. chinensis]|uniref:Actin cytoskeleton-regulatory complex protein n=1 Tax=Actinidia chinensis var. chinensis TaxID=1590841 RepID=A0A2R6QHG3_ACTCC|nr:Actin cytoskeleton-regulatory complex protein [Actinidia chinensis var. chinensis]